MAITRAGVRARVYLLPEFGREKLGFASSATGTATDGVTDTLAFGANLLGEFQYADGWIHFPSLLTTERVKRAGALSGTKLLHADAAAYSTTLTSLAYEWTVPHVHPDEFNRCIRDSMRELPVINHLPETPWTDGNFEQSGTTEWPVAVSTRAKQPDAVYGLVGSQSLVVTNSSASGYAANNSALNVQPGQKWQLHALARLVSGTGPLRFRIYDYTAGSLGSELDDAAVAYGFTPVLLPHVLTIPDDVYRINCLLQSDGASDVHAWDALPGRLASARRFTLDTYAKAGYNIQGVAEAEYGAALKAGTRARDAMSRSFKTWNRGPDYDTEHDGASSTPNVMRLNREPRGISSETEIWYTSRRSWADVDDLDTESASSEVPDDMIVFATAAKVARILDMPDVAAMYESKATAQAAARPVATPPQRRHRIGGRVGP